MAIDIEKSYFYKLHILKSVSDTYFDHTLRLEVGVGLTHFILIATIHRFQPVSQQHIAKFLDVTAGAISRQIDAVQQNGWVEVGSDKKDRRKQLVRLTPEGEKLFTAGDACLTDVGHRIFTTRDEIYKFTGALDEIRSKIETIRPQG